MSLSSLLTYTNMHATCLPDSFAVGRVPREDREGRGRQHTADAICPPLCVYVCVCSPSTTYDATHMAGLTYLEHDRFHSNFRLEKKLPAVHFARVLR